MKNVTILMMLMLAFSTLGVVSAIPNEDDKSLKQSILIQDSDILENLEINQDEWVISVLRGTSGTRLKVRYKLFMNEVDVISLEAYQLGGWGPVSYKRDYTTGTIIISALSDTFYL